MDLLILMLFKRRILHVIVNFIEQFDDSDESDELLAIMSISVLVHGPGRASWILPKVS